MLVQGPCHLGMGCGWDADGMGWDGMPRQIIPLFGSWLPPKFLPHEIPFNEKKNEGVCLKEKKKTMELRLLDHPGGAVVSRRDRSDSVLKRFHSSPAFFISYCFSNCIPTFSPQNTLK